MSHTAVAAPQSTYTDDDIVQKVKWRLLPLIMICYLFAFFDRINISFAKIQLQSDLGFSDTVYGLGASLFTVGYVLFEVPSNVLLYKVGARKWIARIMVSWGLATAAMIFVRGEWSFYTLRFLIGAMEAGFSPGVLYYMTLWFPASHRGRATSLFFLASAFSGVIGAPVSGVILSYLSGVAGLPGWQWLFLAGGVPCVLLGVIVFFYLDDRIEDARWLSPDEKRILAGHVARDTPEAGSHSLFEALRVPGFLMLGLIYFLIQIASYGMNFWVPHLIQTAGVKEPVIIGLISSVPYICGAICLIVIGKLSDASGERRKFLLGLLVGAALGFAGAAFFDQSVVPLMLALALIGASVLTSISTFWTLPPKLVSGAGAAAGIALINTLGQMGGIVSPVMVGRVRDVTGSTTPALYAISALCVVCALLVLFALPDRLRRRDLH